MPNNETLLRILALCVAPASVETLHGIARTVWLAPRTGNERAQRCSIVSGALLAWAVCAAMLPGIRLSGLGAYVTLGLVLAALMAGFDLAMGLLMLRRSIGEALRDFDPRAGNPLVFGLAALALAPAVIGLLQSAR